MTRRTPLPAPTTPVGHVTRYRDRIFDDKRTDPYQARGKLETPTQCTGCGAVYENGRWRWGSTPPDAHAGACPACQRARDKMPAGHLTVDGPYVAAHAAEIIRLARNEAEHETRDHPLHRIMNIDEHAGRIDITTTDVHLPQRIGAALKRAHRGELEVQYASDEYSVRAHWHR